MSETAPTFEPSQAQPPRLSETFARLASHTATLSGSYKTFLFMLGVIIVWACTGPFFGFSATWQLVINTGTTIVTFLMVFLIQNTQNRDSLAVHLKLDEIISAIDSADNEIMQAEDETEEEMVVLKRKYADIARQQAELHNRIKELGGTPNGKG